MSSNGFTHKTRNAFGDTVEAARQGDDSIQLRIYDEGEGFSVLLSRQDLAFVIEGLTAILKGMPEGDDR